MDRLSGSSLREALSPSRQSPGDSLRLLEGSEHRISDRGRFCKMAIAFRSNKAPANSKIPEYQSSCSSSIGQAQDYVQSPTFLHLPSRRNYCPHTSQCSLSTTISLRSPFRTVTLRNCATGNDLPLGEIVRQGATTWADTNARRITNTRNKKERRAPIVQRVPGKLHL